MTDLFSKAVLEFVKPVNFDAENPEFNHFKNLAPRDFSSVKITTFENVHVSNNSVIFRYFKVFKESCISEAVYEKYNKGFKFFLKFVFPQINFSRKKFLLITDEWTSNYYHWHVFALIKLLALKEKNLIEDSILLLPKKYQRYKFALPSLEKFGIKKNQIVFLRRKSNIKIKKLITVETPQQYYFGCIKLREILTRDVQKFDPNFGEKIYISREGQVLRFVENETEVVALLEKYGFKKILADQFSYDEQIAICAKAKYLVSPHGAGLTNTLFMAENSSVLELSPPPSSEKPVTDYYRMLSALKVNYFYQQCEMGEKSRAKDFHMSSLVVDLEKLEQNLKLMLQQ